MFARTLIAAPLALALGAVFMGFAVGPANAATLDTCTTAPAQLRTLAGSADPAKAKKAMYHVVTGEALCEARADREAAKKFALAAKALGTDLASLAAPAAQ